ncbi:MAG: UbiA family prenyltransferase [Candidatus Andersenbacteria bacterium]|nr:UbiA family prenyltransferase [Candidatus Andersenbacteria bacterium]
MNNVPLCVDLDGTLVRTNTLLETTLITLKKNPFFLISLVKGLPRGKAFVKRLIGKQFSTDPATLPYNTEFLDWIRQERANGRTLILATASDELIAKKIADYLGIFSAIIASTPEKSVTADGKALVLCAMYGSSNFSYAGNSHSDLSVWNCSNNAILVDAPNNITSQIKKEVHIEKEFTTHTAPKLKVIAKTMRIHQWVKNTLLFIPALAAHELFQTHTAIQAIVGFLSFSLLASAVYIFNDITDIPSDRAHATKKFRPIASGAIAIKQALALGVICSVASIALSLLALPISFLLILAIYLGINICYSLFAKKIAYLDIIILASLYVLRVFAGSFATGIATSKWLFVWTLFFFLSLAIMKRVIELLKHTKEEKLHGRGYHKADRLILEYAGIASASISVIILALYIHSPSIFVLYTSPALLWGMVGVVMLWLGRIWTLALQGELPDDPVLFAATDPISYGAICVIIATMLLASH